MRIEEYKRIFHVIKNTKVLYWDKVSKNFLIPFYDRKNPDKRNKICFYKDISGNYEVTIGKVDKRNILNASKKILVKVGVGVAPTIHKSFQKYPVRYLPASTTNSIIPNSKNKSSKINKSLFTNWKVELHNLCEKKGLDYDSIIQKYDSQMIRFDYETCRKRQVIQQKAS